MTVGRAIKYNHCLLNEKKWVIVLNQPCKKFRLVEDEPEVSYVKWIKGDGEEWSLGSIETKPASFFGANDGSVHYFEFSNEVSVLETFGYYNLIGCFEDCCTVRKQRE